MANTQKAKAVAVEVKEVAEVQDQEVVQAVEVKEVVKTPAKKVRKELDRNLMVECRNVQNSPLTYLSRKTLGETNWTNFGDVEYLELSELMTMKASQPKFLNEPWIVIDDEDVIEYLGLKSIYDRIVSIEQIDDFFNKSPQEIEEIISKAPKGTKDLIADKAREMVANETLHDIRIMRVLDKALNIDLTMIQN